LLVISSLPLQGGMGSLDGVEAEREPTNLAPGVGVRDMSRIPIMKGLMDFLVTKGSGPLWFHRVRVRRTGGTG
jgi:hypothetical protein